MKRKLLGLLVLGIALVRFASSAMTTGPYINYVSQTGSTVTADYFGLPANSQLIFVNSSTGATTTSVAALSGTSTITVSTITVPRAATTYAPLRRPAATSHKQSCSMCLPSCGASARV